MPTAGAGRTHTAWAALLVVVAIAVAVALLSQIRSTPTHTTSSTKPSTTTPTSVPSTTTVPLIAPADIKLQVLNGLITGSISSEFSAKLHREYGYNTLAPDNTTTTDTTSTIYVLTSGYLPEAEVLAKEVGLPSSAIDRTVPPPSSAPIPSAVLSQANLVLVVGSPLDRKA